MAFGESTPTLLAPFIHRAAIVALLIVSVSCENDAVRGQSFVPAAPTIKVQAYPSSGGDANSDRVDYSALANPASLLTDESTPIDLPQRRPTGRPAQP